MATRSKQKALERQAKADTRPRATAKFIRISPFKVRIVLDVIKGKPVTEALAILENTPKAASEVLLQARQQRGRQRGEQHEPLPSGDLVVAECYANEGPTLKRIMPRARGRAFRINKRTSHITVILDSVNA